MGRVSYWTFRLNCSVFPFEGERNCTKNTYSGQNIISYFKDTGDYFNDYFMLFQESVCLNFIFQKEHEVEKMFTLKGGRIPSAAVKNIVFFVRPRLELMDIIAENVAR